MVTFPVTTIAPDSYSAEALPRGSCLGSKRRVSDPLVCWEGTPPPQSVFFDAFCVSFATTAKFTAPRYCYHYNQ